MSHIKMNEFGIILTGRPYGKDCLEKIQSKKAEPPFLLDFGGVVSLGSSFGEEVVVPLAKKSSDTIQVRLANPAVKDCLEKIVLDFNLNLKIID